jgi:hypothetical protein
MHETTKLNIDKMNEKYRVTGSKGWKKVKFQSEDLDWLHLRKSKLMSRADGLFKILKKINDNAYKLEFPLKFGVSSTLNILDLRSYLGEEDMVPLRMTSIQKGEDDENITTSDTTTSSIGVYGPIIRSRAQQLNYQVNLFLCWSADDLENILLYNNLIVIRNQGVDH